MSECVKECSNVTITFCTLHIQGLEVFGNGFCRGGVVEELGQENVDSCYHDHAETMGENGRNIGNIR